jgi:lipopolysaccharide transport system ATP-binding protein
MLSDDILLSVDHVSKRFCRSLRRSIRYGLLDIVQEVSGLRQESRVLRTGEFWALNDVSFSLKRGDSLGIVGPNGSGKTTLLRIISGLIKPDAGTVTVRGRVAPLLALGAGFSPVLTGRENAYVNMTILGLSPQQIHERFSDVVEFAEIGDALDAPVQTYSSGMVARLGFACAVHAVPDIMLIDEVLSVGDVRFRSKCYRKLAELRKMGIAMIMVTHNTNAVLTMTDKVLYLTQGKEVVSGDPAVVMSQYEEDMIGKGASVVPGQLSLPAKSKEETTGLDITSLSFRDETGVPINTLISGQQAILCVGCTAQREIEDVSLSILVKDVSGEEGHVLNLSSERDGYQFYLDEGHAELVMNMPYCGMKPGIYVMKAYLHTAGLHIYDVVESFYFRVSGDGGMTQCLYFQPRNWMCSQETVGSARKIPRQ